MNQYSKRRKKVLDSLKDNSAVLIFSGNALYRSEDETYPFSVNRNFYYLTGLDKEGMVLLLTKIDGLSNEIVFILPYDETMAKWVGGRLLADEVKEISNIKKVEEVEYLDEYVASLLNRMRRDNDFKLYFDLWHYSMNQQDSEATLYARKISDKYPNVIIKDIYPVLTDLRLIKDEEEISNIRQAIHITNLGIKQMMKTAKPGLNEMTMEGAFDYVLRENLCKNNAFETIAASGKRATILHYSENNNVMEDNELFLCDLGATKNYYCADISRTFPVNGKFTDRQKEIYQLVLNAQKIVQDNARPGVKMKELNQLVVDYYKEELPKHGLDLDVSEYYYHSVSHHLGLDTHDVSGGLGDVLKAGNVITNEPGLYIEEEGIGIRIEDDLLITEDGVEVLSEEIIKNPDEIESFMSGN